MMKHDTLTEQQKAQLQTAARAGCSLRRAAEIIGATGKTARKQLDAAAAEIQGNPPHPLTFDAWARQQHAAYMTWRANRRMKKEQTEAERHD